MKVSLPNLHKGIDVKWLCNNKTTPKNVQKTRTRAITKFGETFTPNVLQADWYSKSGWSKPYFAQTNTKLTLPYSASCLHYALSCFEGMKAYADSSGNVRLFRPGANAKRFQKSCARLAFPTLRVKDFVELICCAVRRDASWVPRQADAALYIRPFMFSTDPSLRIAAAHSVKFCILLAPVRSYYNTTGAETGLLVERKAMRAWPGGTGSLKLSCNYAPTVLPLQNAYKSKCIQTLWLGPEGQCTEAGSMNIFFVFAQANGSIVVKTPHADDLTLPGVVRSSIIALLRQKGVKVRIEHIYLKDILRGIRSKAVVECFGCGTAATITPISFVRCDGKSYHISNKQHSIASKLLSTLKDIQYGRKRSHWSVLV